MLKIKGCENKYQKSTSQNKTSVFILISDEIYFDTQNIKSKACECIITYNS